jgi:hypothetical protein
MNKFFTQGRALSAGMSAFFCIQSGTLSSGIDGALWAGFYTSKNEIQFNMPVPVYRENNPWVTVSTGQALQIAHIPIY